MDGDIDIEEHDILDNPQVSNLFPDLSKIKNEFMDDDVTIVEHSPDLEIKEEVDSVDEHQESDAIFKTEINNTTDTNVSDVVIGIENSSRIINHTALSSDSLYVSQRASIVKTSDASLFTKSNQNISLDNTAQVTRNTRSVVKEPGGNSSKSVVKTIVKKSVASRPNLIENKASNCVDLKCNPSGSSTFRNYIIIGGTNNYNKPKVSSPNVNIISNKIILGSKAPQFKTKEYLPAVVVLKDCRSDLKANARYCDSCKILFPTKNDFDAHKMSTHSISIEFTSNDVVDTGSENDSDISQFSGSVQNSVSSENSSKSVNTKNIKMKICVNKRKLTKEDEESINSAKRFRNAAKNIKNVQNSISNFDGTITGEKCYHCYKVFANNSELIKHLYSLLLDKSDNNDVAKVKDTLPKSLFKCQICNETFPNDTVANFHKRFLHPNQTGSIIESCNVNIKKKQTISNNKTDLIKKNKLINTNALVAKNVVTKKQNVEYQFRAGVLIKNPPIPISVVFKCSKCDLHFIVAHTARNHSKLCKNLIKQYECKKCQRKFKQCDLKMHELQHLVTNLFRAYVIQKNLLKRLLCRCPKCNICFSEGLFAKHLMNPCIKKFIHCKTCNLNINTETYVNTCHENCGDYIIIDYFDNDQKCTVKNICAKESVKEKKIKTYRLWYCETCKMCGRLDIRNHNCDVSSKRLCYSCGLYFSPKRIETHKTMHSEQPLSLQNFLMFSLEKRKFIQPPMPCYKVCATCKMHYLKWHTSCSKSYKICEFCSKKFEKEHYEMHKNFHTYNLDDLINKTLRNGGYVGFKPSLYIYQCVQCKCFTNKYDQAVRHSKYHVTRKHQKKIKCNVCGNIFDTFSFQGHKHNITKYKILRFNYKKLLSDAWFDMFDGLDQIEIGDILMESVFKDTRSLDLTLIQKGDPEKTLYICSSCNIIIDKIAIEKHVLHKLCISRNRKYRCDICDLYFFSADNLETHTKLHSIGVKKEDFNIISIMKNSTENIDVATLKNYNDDEPEMACNEDALQRKGRNKKDRSMNKEISDVNESSVDSKTAYVDHQFVIQDTNLNKPEYFANDNIKEVNLYKCMNCKACILPGKYFGNHYCAGNLIRFCEPCKQFYYKSSWAKHCLLIHSDPKNISFKFKCFHMKINSQGRRQPYVVKVESKLYDKSKIRSKMGLHKNSIATVQEFEEINKDISDEEDSRSGNKSEGTGEESDETSEVSLNKSRGKVQINVPITNIQSINIHNENTNRKSKIYKKSTIDLKEINETDNNISSDEVSQGNVTNNVNSNGFNEFSLAKGNLARSVFQNNEGTKEIILFKCINCKTCVFRRKTITRHTCTIEFYNKFCNICQQWFSMGNWDLHNIIHENSKKINIRVKYFKPKTIVYSKRTLKRKRTIKANAINKKRQNENRFKNLPMLFRNMNNSGDENGIEANANINYKDNVGRKLKFNADEGNNIREKNVTIADDSTDDEMKHIAGILESDKCKKVESRDTLKERYKSIVDAGNSTVIASNKKDIVMYKCTCCLICTKIKNVHHHRCLINSYKRFCKICKQYFFAPHFARHIQLHQEYAEINLVIKHYTPVRVKRIFNRRENQKESVSVKNYKTTSNHETLSENMGSNKEIHELDESDKEDEINEIVIPKDSDNREVRNLKLYKCIKCSVCFLTTSNLYRHVCVMSYVSKRFCEICQQSFISHNYHEHHSIHNNHKKINIIIIYFEPNTVSYYGTRNKNVKVKLSIATNKNDFYKVYHCDECDLYYLSKKSRETHIIKFHHKIVREPKVCTYCELKFASISFKRHIKECPLKIKQGYIRIIEYKKASMKIHKRDSTVESAKAQACRTTKNKSRLVKIRKLNKKNSNETCLKDDNDGNVADFKWNVGNTKVYVNKRKSSSKVYLDSSLISTTYMSNKIISDADNNITEDLELMNDNENIDDRSTSPVNTKSTNSGVIDSRHVKASNTNNCTIKENSENNSTLMSDETKLYTCGACEVYFLKAECCQAHIVNHVKLDTREYIQCKLCLLQFLIIDLHKHMLAHHNDELKFKGVFVEEFMPNENQLRIYKLKDKLQSLVISTTSMETD